MSNFQFISLVLSLMSDSVSKSLKYIAILASFSLSECNYGDPFGMITKIQTFCEHDAITMASKLSDTYNSLDEITNRQARMQHEFIVEHLGFGWDAAFSGKDHGEVVHSSESVANLQEVSPYDTFVPGCALFC